jgi:A/G-specific adenine glycosylase
MATKTQERFHDGILHAYKKGARSFPWRDTRDPYAVLIGEILLQRTRGENAVLVFEGFMQRWPTPSALANARTSSIARVIEPIGLAKRSAVLHQLGRELVKTGGVPKDVARLEELPGVGPYTANAVLVFAFGRNGPLVDWVIARVLRRFFDLPNDRRPNGDPALWKVAGELAKLGQARKLWFGTLDFAARICKPLPLCGECHLRAGCAYFAKKS